LKENEEETMEHQDSYDPALKRVDAKIGFAIHLVVYIFVNAALIAINLRSSPEYLGFIGC
jgi:hypothetical protein